MAQKVFLPISDIPSPQSRPRAAGSEIPRTNARAAIAPGQAVAPPDADRAIQLRIALQPARMLAEVSLAILSTPLWVAAACWTALVCVYLKADFGRHRQDHTLPAL